MPTRSEHREAVARRLELLHAGPDHELVPDDVPADEAPWWESTPVLELVPPASDDPAPPAVPVPGRHADRRPPAARAWLADRTAEVVPEILRHPRARPARAGIGPWHMVVLAVAVAAALGLTCWWVMRDDPTVAPVASGTVAPLTPVGVTASAVGGAPASADAVGVTPSTASVGASGSSVQPSVQPPAQPSAASSPATVTVDVAGKVLHPQVVVLPAGSRVIDAIKAAGGARPRADLSALNRARVLVDGEQILVGGPTAPASAAPAPAPSTGSSAGPPAALVNLNTATVAELDTLPGVGPVTAQAIVDYRTEHGGFGSVDELLDVERIGEATLAKIAPHVTV